MEHLLGNVEVVAGFVFEPPQLELVEAVSEHFQSKEQKQLLELHFGKASSLEPW